MALLNNCVVSVEKRCVLFLLLLSCLLLGSCGPGGGSSESDSSLQPELRAGTQFGIKYNRGVFEYPDAVLTDLDRFAADRITTVMLSLPWSQWTEGDGHLDQDFINGPLREVLDFCEQMNITVILSVHCSFWGENGDWSIPDGVRAEPSYVSSSSVITNPVFQQKYIEFIQNLISSTHQFPAVIGYNILNEPVAATEVSTRDGIDEFQARWAGVINITETIKAHMDNIGFARTPGLIVGMANGDPEYAEYIWNDSELFDLSSFWTETLNVISGQYLNVLAKSEPYFPYIAKIRTEGFLSFAVQEAQLEGRPYCWDEDAEHAAMYYDYDAIYEYEGLGNASINNLMSAYVWRVGSPDGSKKHLRILDHRNDNRPTPYYYALRDLASGVDSFEAYHSSILPENEENNLAFDMTSAQIAISKFWSGTGRIEPRRQPAPLSTSSTMSAKINLLPGEYLGRSVISTHWTSNNVGLESNFQFEGWSDVPGSLSLFVDTKDARYFAEVYFPGSGWESVRVKIADLGFPVEDISEISMVGFQNQTASTVSILVDDFLIR